MRNEILSILKRYSKDIYDPSNAYLLYPHEKYDQHETFVVDASESIKRVLKENNVKTSLLNLIKIYQKFSGQEDADEKRADEFMALAI